MDLERFLTTCVFVDVELRANGRLGRLGAVCGDAQFRRTGRRPVRESLDDLDRFVTGVGARFLAGHNVVQHDWIRIRRAAPDLKLLRLPLLDTLLLSPLAFPENPYHALVKDYKLVKDTVNDPEDGRAAGRVPGSPKLVSSRLSRRIKPAPKTPDSGPVYRWRKGRRYTKGDFKPLAQHYQEQILQVHVMYEYARRGVESIRDGLQLILSYFSEQRADFLEEYFGDRKDEIQRAITREAYQRIVDHLDHPAQQVIVTAPVDRNMLIQAGCLPELK